eukprot:444606_1
MSFIEHDSNTFINEINNLLKEIENDNILLTYGFVRQVVITCKLNVPTSIINYLIIYSFLKLDYWLEDDNHKMIIDGHYARPSTTDILAMSVSLPVTTYGNQLVSKGIHEWKIQIIKHARRAVVGIVSVRCTAPCFYTTKYPNYAYSYDGEKTNYNIDRWQPYTYDKEKIEFKDEDIIGIHLNLNKNTIGFSKNEIFIGIAYDNVPEIKYKMAVTMPSHSTIVKMISYKHILTVMDTVND